MENSATKTKNEKSPPFSLKDKLMGFQNERILLDSHYKDVRLSVNLLDRFIQGEFLNQLVVTLYPVGKGYTLALKTQNALENETALIPYEEDELLNCIDNQQLPPVLIEILEEAGAQVFYDGCVFVEVRDLRTSLKNSWNVLLKPTPQTILADAQQICISQGWGQEELLQIESILCMAMAEPLCLSPNPAVGELAVNSDSATKQMHNTSLRQNRRSWCESRKRKQAEASHLNTDFKLHDFLKKKSLLREGIPPILHPRIDQTNPSTSSSFCSSSTPVQIDVSDVLRLAKPLERPTKESTDSSIIPFEEYLYETDRVNGRVYLVRLTIFHRPVTDEYLGQLYVDRDYRDSNSIGGASCMFSLGTRQNVQRYLQQFTEIFTEEGRKAVKITHQVANQPPRVMYTQSMREKERQREKEEQQQQLLQQQQQQTQQQTQQHQQQIQIQRQQPQLMASAQTANVSKDSSDMVHVNIASIPVKTEPAQGQAVQAKATWLDGLKSGQVNPALASLVSTLISSAQQQQQPQQQQQQPTQIQIQQQHIRPVGTTVGVNTNVVIANGHHQQQQSQQQQPQSLLRPSTAVRAQNIGNITATTLSGQSVQLVTTNYNLQQPGQPRPTGTVRPGTALAALLTNSKSTTLPPNISPGKGKIMQTDIRTTGSVVGTSTTPSANTILMGQLVRAANSGSAPVLPSYTQAIGQTASGATVVRAMRPTVPGSTITGTIVRRQGEQVAINGTAGTQRISLTVPALSALLAGTPSADSPNSNSTPPHQNVPTLLERLQQASPNKPATSNLNNNHAQVHAIKSSLASSNNNINVQSINLTNVQGAVANLPLQSIQVSIPRLGVPITLSLAVTSAGTSTSSTASVVGSVRLTSSSGGLATAGQPISIPLSVLQQIPNAAGAAGVQLVGNVSTKDGTIVQQLKVASNSGTGTTPLSTSSGQSSGSLLAQQQLQMALQRQVQMQLPQKVVAKQKSKPPNS